MLLDNRLEALLRLDDLGVRHGLRAELDLDLLQLLPLAHHALQALLQDVLAESPAAVDGDGAVAIQSPRPFLHAQQRPKQSLKTAAFLGASEREGGQRTS